MRKIGGSLIQYPMIHHFLTIEFTSRLAASRHIQVLHLGPVLIPIKPKKKYFFEKTYSTFEHIFILFDSITNKLSFLFTNFYEKYNPELTDQSHYILIEFYNTE